MSPENYYCCSMFQTLFPFVVDTAQNRLECFSLEVIFSLIYIVRARSYPSCTVGDQPYLVVITYVLRHPFANNCSYEVSWITSHGRKRPSLFFYTINVKEEKLNNIGTVFVVYNRGKRNLMKTFSFYILNVSPNQTTTDHPAKVTQPDFDRRIILSEQSVIFILDITSPR